MARFRNRRIGIVFQFFNLLDDLTVADNVLLLDLVRSGQSMLLVTHNPDLAASCVRARHRGAWRAPAGRWAAKISTASALRAE